MSLECVLTEGRRQVQTPWSQETAFLIPHMTLVILNQSPWMASLAFCETGWESDCNFSLQLLTEANIPFTHDGWQEALAVFAVPMAGTEIRSPRYLCPVYQLWVTSQTTVCTPHNLHITATILLQASSCQSVFINTFPRPVTFQA